jgi:hypothetical protein
MKDRRRSGEETHDPSNNGANLDFDRRWTQQWHLIIKLHKLICQRKEKETYRYFQCRFEELGGRFGQSRPEENVREKQPT